MSEISSNHTTHYKLCRRSISQNLTFVPYNQEECHSVLHQIQKIIRYCSQSFFFEEKRFCFICFLLPPQADHQGSKLTFCDFRWIGPHVIEKAQPTDKNIVRKLITNKNQLLHKIPLRKYNPRKPPEDNYQKGKQDRSLMTILSYRRTRYTPLHGAYFGGQEFDLPFIYTDANALF